MKYLLLLIMLLPATVFAAPLYCEDFDDELSGGPFRKEVDATLYSPNTSEEQFVTSPARSGKAMHYFIPASTNEKAPISVHFENEDFNTYLGTNYGSELFVEWWEYWETGYPWPTGTQKIFRTGYADDAPNIAEYKRLNFTSHVENTSMQIDAQCGYQGDETLCSAANEEVDSGDPLPEGEWFKMGVWFDWNNDIAKGYVNGVLVAELTGNFGGNTVRGSNYFWIGGNFSMLGGVGTAANDGHRYIDDVCVYETWEDTSSSPGASESNIIKKKKKL